MEGKIYWKVYYSIRGEKSGVFVFPKHSFSKSQAKTRVKKHKPLAKITRIVESNKQGYDIKDLY